MDKPVATAFADVVAELVAVLGRHNVAAIGGATRTSAVADWINAKSAPDSDIEARLRLALRLLRIIETRFSKSTASAWLQGSNPDLDDEMPIALVATAPLEKFEKALITAAHAFVQI
jgi:hypothetical protein